MFGKIFLKMALNMNTVSLLHIINSQVKEGKAG